MIEFLLSFYFFVFGLLIGSFLNVVILRLPVGKDLVMKRSGCPKCGAQLRWYHNIPLISFLVLKGKCGFCRTPISWRYPLIEFITGLVSLLLMPEFISVDSMAYFLFYFATACIFICHFFIDLDHHLLLDSLNLYLLSMFLPFAIFHYSWAHWAIGGALGLGAPLLVTWLFYKIKGQVGLGGGDIKLYGIFGLLFGPTGIMFNIFLSCFVGAIVGVTLIAMKKMSKDKPLAFGPFILFVGTLQIFFPKVATYIQSLWF